MTYEQFSAFIHSSFDDLSPQQDARFRQLEALYRDWNSKINVISRKDIDSLYSHHVLHSLAIAQYLKIALPDLYCALRNPTGNINLLDIGTGGGFPGIPLAILFPGGRFTLCDSIGKKTKVALSVARSCGLDNVEVVNARAEEIQGQFDYIVSRAVTSLENFLPWTKGKSAKGLFYLKGGDVAGELGMVMPRFRLKQGSVHTWRVDSWIDDGYFDGKVVVHIEF